MADDASYNTFLTKVNQSTSDPATENASDKIQSTGQARSRYDPTLTKTTSGGTDPETLPEPLRDLNATYVSDTDEQFKPVFFNYSGADLPGVDEFKQVLGSKGDGKAVEELNVQGFDPRGEYKDVVNKVRQSGLEGKGIKIFRVEVSRTRCEYFIVTIGEDGRKLVGVSVKAVES